MQYSCYTENNSKQLKSTQALDSGVQAQKQEFNEQKKKVHKVPQRNKGAQRSRLVNTRAPAAKRKGLYVCPEMAKSQGVVHG